jgi:hypothetical protein
VDNLWTDERDGQLVANPSNRVDWGPPDDRGQFTLGYHQTQGIVAQVFSYVLAAAKALGLEGDAEVAEVKAALARLFPPKIGLGGEYLTWKDETTTDVIGNIKSINHGHGIHPGNLVVAGRSPADDALIEAFKHNLRRGLRPFREANAWARARSGNECYESFAEHVHDDTATNLLNTPGHGDFFQLEGTSCMAAAFAEMLLQSHGGKLELLPALPGAWASGTVSGIRGRGGFAVDEQWEGGKLVRAEIVSLAGNECIVKYADLAKFQVTGATPTVDGDDQVRFPTTAGSKYVFSKPV